MSLDRFTLLAVLCVTLAACGSSLPSDSPADASDAGTAQDSATRDTSASNDASADAIASDNGPDAPADADSENSADTVDSGDTALTCEDLDCDDVSRECVTPSEGDAMCGACLPGFADTEGLCVPIECTGTDECEVPAPTEWSECAYEDVCAEEGSRVRTIHVATCVDGECVVSSEQESELCTRDTEGVIESTVGECVSIDDSNPCETEGLATTLVQSCVDGALVESATVDACAIDTEGEIISEELFDCRPETPCALTGMQLFRVLLCEDGQVVNVDDIGACAHTPDPDFWAPLTWFEPYRDYEHASAPSACIYSDACAEEGVRVQWGYECEGGEFVETIREYELGTWFEDIPGYNEPTWCDRDTEGEAGWGPGEITCGPNDYRIVECDDEGRVVAERRSCAAGSLGVDVVEFDCGFCALGECISGASCEIVPPEDYIYVPPGTFRMGVTSELYGDADEMPQHDVTITRGMFVAQLRITRGEIHNEMIGLLDPESRMERIGAYDASVERSVEAPDGVSADYDAADALWLINEYSFLSALPRCYNDAIEREDIALRAEFDHPADCPGYRFPTEAEWEYFAKAGSEGNTYFGNLAHEASCEEVVEFFAGHERPYCETGFTRLPPDVGSFLPSPWGLFDMLSLPADSVFEAELRAYTSEPVVDPWSGDGVFYRGKPNTGASFSSATARFHRAVHTRLWTNTFRLVRTAPPIADLQHAERRD